MTLKTTPVPAANAAQKASKDKPATTIAALPAKSSVSNLTLGNADDALTLAKELQRFVKENKLTSNIQGKEFPNVEAWQFAGGLLGLASMLESIEDKTTENEIKWHATVQVIHIATGNVVGRGFASCSNKESTKKFFADYAICSMAQTRAVGKAYRLSLGWLMKAAGFEATPFEEMSEVGTSATVVESPAPTMAVSREPVAEAPASPLASVEGELLTASTKKLILLAIDAYDANAKGGEGYEAKLLDSLETMLEAAGQKVLVWLEKQPKKKAAGKRGSVPPADTSPCIVDEFKLHPTTDDRSPMVFATPEQKTEINRLIDLPVITRRERTMMILNINRLDDIRADDAIKVLAKTVEEREGGAGAVAVAAAA